MVAINMTPGEIGIIHLDNHSFISRKRQPGLNFDNYLFGAWN
jgi:hypothetical protein